MVGQSMAPHLRQASGSAALFTIGVELVIIILLTHDMAAAGHGSTVTAPGSPAWGRCVSGVGPLTAQLARPPISETNRGVLEALYRNESLEIPAYGPARKLSALTSL